MLNRGKKTVKRETVKVRAKGKRSSLGQFKFSRRMVSPGMYRIQACSPRGRGTRGSKNSSRPFRIRYPSLKEGNSGPAAKMLNTLLGNLGYVNGGGSSYNSATGRAVLAYRKVNGMARKEKADRQDLQEARQGQGRLQAQAPGRRQARRDRPLPAGDGARQAWRGRRDLHDLLGRPRDADDPGQVPLLPQGRGLQQPRDVLLGLLHPRVRDPRLPRRARPIPPATAACGTRSPTRSTSTTGSTSATRSTSTRIGLSRMSARETLIAELREHALVIGEVTLTSGATASYYVDAKRAILRQPAFGALGELVAAEANERGATAVGGMTMGADPIASAAIGDPGRPRPARLLRPQGEEAARPATLGRGAAARRRDEGADRRGRGHDRRLDGARRSSAASRRAWRSSARSRSSTAWPAAPRTSPRHRTAPPTTPLATIDDVYPERESSDGYALGTLATAGERRRESHSESPSGRKLTIYVIFPPSGSLSVLVLRPETLG